ncbi:NAD(P)-dependent alcohol dehydrogenase [Krasilnikovia sp. MM14-A1259]|uniref:NAD(P)-dependent alcohol dehydrogenase n=1 Tax=Krasilnikovia sp. MM14-A1259 TaxID=3373539 RepID=UPI00399C6276
MRAVVQDRYGAAPEGLLRCAETARPQIGPGEVLVRVCAASVDRGTWHMMAGLPYPVRAAGFGLRRPKNANPGRALAGVVAAVGADVTGLEPGDEVLGVGAATFAEYACARADKLAKKPANLSFAQAATLGVSGLTALQAVRNHARVTAGQKVLVLGASGGVGAFAVQLAKADGAEVTGVCSTTKVGLVRSLGADRVVDYTREDALDGGTQYDVIIDTGGNRRLADLRRALTATGRLVIVGGETGGRWLGGTDRQLRAQLLSGFVGQRLGSFLTSENATDLGALAHLCASGDLTAAVDRTYPLAETAAAIRHMLDGHVRGKVVITV